MWIGDVGISGINAVAEILAGNVTPSGSLVDTYLYDNFSAPAMMNFVPTVYEGYEEGIIPEHAKTYMIYQEGIYVGYKYYETRYEDYVMQSGNSGAYEYHDDVAYPFGYGMSYTDFKYSDLKVSYNKEKDVFEVSVKVTNTGKEYSGKETVQVYFQSDNERDRGFRTVLLNPLMKGYSAFQPAAGISIAYNDMKILEVHALFDAITNGADYVTDFEFGYKIDRTVAAVIESSKTHEWVDVK